MDLILWRHAEAEDPADGQDDLDRALTSRGEKQAARVAAWLDRQLPDGAKILTSPARRCEQTVLALGRKYKIRDELAPDATPDDILEAAQWPVAKQPVVVVGHQPVLGETIARLLAVEAGSVPVRKGSVWWLRTRERDGHEQTVVWAVHAPESV
ncbi:SixA phosphatase family protein [Ramlibacter albus]|uniref:Histidine phosphatase family protein n=1 Tax=Ramlibacter albus TaxID=2079448 RepID=A0A923MBT3_9BURK|nr:histidine phosphatase family protein [Ramlibacter albus]MBC5766631.1 histidine phosphatase family protein [Ramlibacter albus]